MNDELMEGEVPPIDNFEPESIVDAQEYMDNLKMPIDEYVDRLWDVLKEANDFVTEDNKLTREEISSLIESIQVIGPEQEAAVLNWQVDEVQKILKSNPSVPLILLHGGGRSGKAIDDVILQRFEKELMEKSLILVGRFTLDEGFDFTSLPKDVDYSICMLEDKSHSGAQIQDITSDAILYLSRIGININKTFLRLGGISSRAQRRISLYDDIKTLYHMPNGEEIDDRLAKARGDKVGPLSKIRNCFNVALAQIQEANQLVDLEEYEILQRTQKLLIDRIFDKELTIHYQRIPDEWSFPNVFTSRQGLWWPNKDKTDYEKIYLLDFYKNRVDNK